MQTILAVLLAMIFTLFGGCTALQYSDFDPFGTSDTPYETIIDPFGDPHNETIFDGTSSLGTLIFDVIGDDAYMFEAAYRTSNSDISIRWSRLYDSYEVYVIDNPLAADDIYNVFRRLTVGDPVDIAALDHDDVLEFSLRDGNRDYTFSAFFNGHNIAVMDETGASLYDVIGDEQLWELLESAIEDE